MFGRQWVDHGHCRREVLTLVVAIDKCVRVHLLVAANTDQPWVLAARKLALLNATEMDVPRYNEMGAVLVPDRLALETVERGVERSTFEVMRSVDTAERAVWENQLDLRLPVVNRDLNARGAHAPDDFATFIPVVVIAKDHSKPRHA